MNKKKDEHKQHVKDHLNPQEQRNQNTSQEQPMNEQGNQNEVPVILDRETELTAALATANDKYLRLSAEFDNFRKRTLKEKMDLMRNASESVMVSFLPVIDDVERAMKAIELSDNLDTTKEGIVLIYNKFKDFTKNQGIVEMEAYGMEFNTDHHEAITKIPAPSEDLKGKIVDVVQKGYLLNDKVIRYAKVVIGE